MATTIAALFGCVSVVAFSTIRPHAPAHTPSPQQVVNWGIVIHGGAGTIDTTRMSPLERQLRRDALTRALTAGHRILAAGGRSLDAVQAAIVTLEDDSLFNAGKGGGVQCPGHE
jgi:L-asparaginase / beta-aspartyl-peptidase